MRDSIYDYEQHIARYRRVISELRNGDVALHLLDHLASLRLSPAALSNNAAHLVAVLRLIDFDVAKAMSNVSLQKLPHDSQSKTPTIPNSGSNKRTIPKPIKKCSSTS